MSEVAVELEPIAAAEGVRLIVLNSTPLPVHSHRVRVQSLVFRTLDSILSLTRKKCEMRVATVYEEDYGCLIVTSTDGSAVAGALLLFRGLNSELWWPKQGWGDNGSNVDVDPNRRRPEPGDPYAVGFVREMTSAT